MDELLSSSLEPKTRPTRPRFFNVSNHALTDAQRAEATSRFNCKQIVDLPPELKTCWSDIPPDTDDLAAHLHPVQDWLMQNSSPEDCILLQGEPGATVLLACRLARTGRVLLHATTQRIVTEHQREDGTVESRRLFQHARFRRYVFA